jgi:hypothetical protein
LNLVCNRCGKPLEAGQSIMSKKGPQPQVFKTLPSRLLCQPVHVGEKGRMRQRALSCYLVENVQTKGKAYVNRTVYDVPRALLNEFLLENGCPDYGAVTPAIIDLIRKAVEDKKDKS